MNHTAIARRRPTKWLLWCPPGVYRPQTDTWLLAEQLHSARIRPGAAILEIGCGSGALSVLAARTTPRSVTAVDVSRRAVWTTRINTLLRVSLCGWNVVTRSTARWGGRST